MKRATSRRPTASETNRWVCGTVQDETSVSPHCKGTVRQIFTHPTLLSSRSGRQSVEQETQEIRITTTHCANDSEFNAALFADMNTGCFLVPTDELILPSRRQSRRTTCPGPFSHAQVENVLELSPRGAKSLFLSKPWFFKMRRPCLFIDVVCSRALSRPRQPGPPYPHKPRSIPCLGKKTAKSCHRF